MNTTTKVILGMSVAAAAGAAIGMLLAPEKGSDLQKRLKEGTTDWITIFTSLINTGKEVASEFRIATQNELEEFTTETSERDLSTKENSTKN